MKKLLSLLIFCLIGICARATDVVFDASVTTSGNETASEQTISLDGVTLHLTNGILGTSGQYRIYKSQTLTVSSETTITKIVFTCTANGTAKYGPGCFAAQEGYSYSGKIGTWEGEANSVAFLAEANQVRATSIVVTIDDGVTPPPVVIPEISTIEEFISLDAGKQFMYTGDLTCVQNYFDGTHRYLYLADNTGGIVVYDPDENTPLYETTDVIPGGWTATKTIYRGLPEATAATDFAEKIGNQNITPIEMTIAEAKSSELLGAWIVVKNVLIREKTVQSNNGERTVYYITGDETDELELFFGHTTPFDLPEELNMSKDTNTDRYDMYGILGIYNTTRQIMPTGIGQNGEIVTSIEALDKDIKKVTYYNIQGIESSKPFDGVNIVTIEYDNGIKKINKIIKR